MTRDRTIVRYLVAISGLSLGSSLCTHTAYAGGNVLPAQAKAKGYSLTDMAAATAVFNTGVRSPETVPMTPFQILYTPTSGPPTPFIVHPGTMLYVPIVYSDTSPPVLGDFPDVGDQAAVASYFFDAEQIGVVSVEIDVNGVATSLGRSYAVGTPTPPLPDGGGTDYATIAAFVNPLPKGDHTVTIRFLATGDALLEFPDFFPDGIWEFEATFDVIVR